MAVRRSVIGVQRGIWVKAIKSTTYSCNRRNGMEIVTATS